MIQPKIANARKIQMLALDNHHGGVEGSRTIVENGQEVRVGC